ncbi:hypothetical protein [Nocardia sp. NBC_01388]|uniref:hypothetical protein n=1 Tax=Nocardia sp. NBC_01388 TaxID=2903596 RepID=UPI0038685120
MRRPDVRDVNRLVRANDSRLLAPPNQKNADQQARKFGTTTADLLKPPGYKKNIEAIANGMLPQKLQRDRKEWTRPEFNKWLQAALPSNSNIGKVQSLFIAMANLRDDKNKSRHTEVFAEEVAKRILMRMGADILPLRKKGSGALDLVAVLDGKLIVIEAKGGGSPLEWAYAQDDAGDWHWVQQGSLVYLRYKLREHAEILKLLKTFKKGKYKDLAERLENGTATVEYSKVHAQYEGKLGNRKLGDVTFTRFDLGVEQTGLVSKPPPGSKKKPSTGSRKNGTYNPPMSDAEKSKWEARRKSVPVPGRGAGWTGRVAIVTGGAAGLFVAAAGAAGATTPGDGPQAPDQIGETGPPQGGERSPDSDILSSLKAKASEFGRMLSSFKDHVLNGLNALATMVTDAASKVSDFVSGVIDSTGAQGFIDEASKLWAEGQDLINFAMLLSPVGTVAEALTVAITVIQTLVDHWDQIRAGFDWALKNVLIPVADFFKTAFKVYITPYRVVFDLVMAGFNGMGGVVGSAVSTVQSVVAGIVMAIGGIFQKLEIHIPSLWGFGGGDFGLKPIGDAMVNWASARMADGGVVRAPGAGGSVRSSGIHVMAVIDQSVVRAAQDERRKVGYAYRPPFLHDGAMARSSAGAGSRTIDLRVPDVDSAFAQIKLLQARHDMRLESAGV